MAPSSFKKLGLAFAVASAGQVAAESYTLIDEYTADNFFDKFDFFVSSSSNTDPTHGYVNYRAQADAESLGLISSSNGKIYIGPDSNQTYSPTGSGRDSVRIMSKAKYNQGLMIAKFSHMPVQSCGSWPAFWSYGSPWLSSGEIDYYEGWNDLGSNVMALHTNKTIAGECLLTTTGVSAKVTTQDCDDEKVDTAINQYVGTGCGVSDTAGVWSSTTGATFAMQWVDDAIKIWNWLPGSVPADITAGTPDPDANSASWGVPQLLVEKDSCDLSKAFANQQLVFNIDFCGDTAGNSVLWANTCSAKGDSCVDYVASTPSAFAETYFMIDGIEFYEMGAGSSSVSASAAASTAAATSAAITSATSSAETTSGLLAGTGSVLETTLGISATILATPVSSAAATSAHSHTTSYITGTSTAVNEAGETTVVVVIDTTICPVTAAEASESSSVLAAASTPVPAHTTATSETSAVATTTPAASVPVVASSTVSTSVITEASTSTATQMTTSTIFATHTSTVASCAAGASGCVVGGETTVIVALSTTICPVTAAEASSQISNATIIGSASRSVPAVVTSIATSSSIAIPSPSSAVPEAAESSTVRSVSTASSRTAAAYTSVPPLAAQSTGAKPTTISKVTKSIAVSQTAQATETSYSSSSETALIMATGTPTPEASVTYGDSTETLSVASATYTYPVGNNGTMFGAASSTSVAATAASETSSCSGIDCIVVSSSGSKNSFGAGGVALGLIAGAMFLL
ncbi:hypothetical protein VM1G_07505 [Cytospora mali]|uniref:GH16 domain-containing protein n=1 Tax=Cytospora mali TaxID=578113 RepID=A0A194W5S5_CYTMA|nr:hypothetical protein VM1G_07505 [Valsa mali]